MIVLNEDLLIAKGSERSCYNYPNDNTKVIKIIFAEGTHNNQNKLEYIYMNYLIKKNTDLSLITKCYGYIDTNIGKGLIFDKVLDFDSAPSKSFRYYLANKLISYDEQKALLLNLQEYLEQNDILFIDTSLTNIFCKKINDKKYTLIIVDGLGAKRMGIKFWLYLNIPLYAKYKMKRQWKKLINMYEKDIIRVELGERPITRI